MTDNGTPTTRLIDCDVHCAAPDVQMLLPYLDEQWREYIAGNGFKKSAAVEYSYPRWSPLATTAEATSLAKLEANVLDGAQHAVLNCLYGLEPIRHPFFAAALARAVNDWTRDQWLDKHEKLLGSMVIPVQDVELAVAEIERLARDRRFTQILLPVRSWEPYGNRRYAPICEAAERNGLVLAIHFGGLTGTAPSAAGWIDSYVEEYACAAELFQAQVSSLVIGGVFDAYPKLRVVLMESGWTWLRPSCGSSIRNGSPSAAKFHGGGVTIRIRPRSYPRNDSAYRRAARLRLSSPGA